MSFTTIISAHDLAALIQRDSPPLMLDCRFELGDPEAGRADYLAGHIAGARYVHLDQDLAAPPSGTNGRHPLPTREAFAETLRGLGLCEGQQVVAYDAAGGAYAARAWWMLRWAGHEAVAVLDGGLPAWLAAGHALEQGEAEAVATGDFALGESLEPTPVPVSDVLANIESGDRLVVDARDPSRYRGEPNAMDPVAGHIPGAANRFFRDNLTDGGRFRDAEALRSEFAKVLGETAPDHAVMQCGSGVTACHNLLAMRLAGLAGARLYPGSWSEWIADPARPVETGEGRS